MFESLKKKLDTFVQKTISEKDLNNALWELEVSLLESDVSMKASEKMVENLKEELLGTKVGMIERKKDIISQALKERKN